MIRVRACMNFPKCTFMWPKSSSNSPKVVKIMIPFGVPMIIRHRIFRVSKKGALILTTTHIGVIGEEISEVRKTSLQMAKLRTQGIKTRTPRYP